MRGKSTCLALLLLAVVEIPGARADDGSAAVLRAFGLEGVWSPDCGKPPSNDNPRVFYRLPPGGPVFHGVTFDGRMWGLIDTVSDAVRLNERLLSVSFVREGAVRFTVTIDGIGDTIHTISSAGADGKVYYRNGFNTDNGAPAPVSHRCDLVSPLS